MNAKPTVNDAIEEYYRLKNKYEIEINNNKKKILNNNELSIKEKQREYLKLKPKCIHCKRAGGTIFSIKYSTPDEYRELKATCGVLADQCNLNITIQLGAYNLLPNVLKELTKEIIETKDIIIDNKNQLLFGFITINEAVTAFESDKEYINEFTSSYDLFLNKLITAIENTEKKKELMDNIEKSYIIINQIKECITNYNETNNKEQIKDAVEIYITKLKPLLIEIRNLKFEEYYVDYNNKTNIYNLVQKTTSIQSLEYSMLKSVVVEYNTKPYNSGKTTIVKPKKIVLIESDTEDEEENKEDSDYEKDSEDESSYK